MLWDFYPVASLLDVGCGDGRWLATAKELGAEVIKGVDGPWTDRSRLLIPREDFEVRDLSDEFDLHQKFDLAMSLEAAEHVAAQHARSFVDNLIRHSDVVLFGAAIPYQGGFRHINERWQSY
jgi:cyclopropane fatty-acyl-phospholipid synthase-like methyltransferase